MDNRLTEHIETAKQAKQQCESEIKAILNMFMLITGLSIQGVDLFHDRTIGGGVSIAAVKIDVRLEGE